MIVIKELKNFVDMNLKFEIEFIIKRNEYLADNKYVVAL